MTIGDERPTALQRLSSLYLRLSAEIDWRILTVLASIAFCHGLLYLAIVPPWQHYDEPTHFEYAALIARHEAGRGAELADLELNHSIADSMYRHRFWSPEFRPWMFGIAPVTIGYDQEVHPPLYYALIAIPISWMQAFPVELQLYAARFVSVICFTLVILTAWRLTCILTPNEPIAQLALPLLIAFMPTYSDLMSAVNNDVLVNFSVTAMLLGCVLLIRDGLRPAALVLAILGLIVALLTKRTAVVALFPFMLSMLWAVRREQLNLRSWLIVVGLIVSMALAMLRFEMNKGGLVAYARPWLNAIDIAYLRLNIEAWLASVSDWERSWPIYIAMPQLLFDTYWLRFAWGHIAALSLWSWLFGFMLLWCSIGLLAGMWFQNDEILLWQRRVIWLFVLALMAALISALLRIHPLPAEGLPRFFSAGRYMFFVMLPSLWLLALGWQRMMPARWRMYSLPLLVGIFAIFDASVWFITLTGYYYVQAVQ